MKKSWYGLHVLLPANHKTHHLWAGLYGAGVPEHGQACHPVHSAAPGVLMNGPVGLDLVGLVGRACQIEGIACAKTLQWGSSPLIPPLSL